jgi:hypothetical protein
LEVMVAVVGRKDEDRVGALHEGSPEVTAG